MNESTFRSTQASSVLPANMGCITDQTNVTDEDWDTQFGVVLAKLKQSVGEAVVAPVPRVSDSAVPIQTIVLECVQALEQLHRDRGPTQQGRLAEQEDENAHITKFLALLGHELRNPMASISYAVALLNSEKSDLQTQRAMRDIIGRQFNQLNQFLNDFLDGSLTPP